MAHFIQMQLQFKSNGIKAPLLLNELYRDCSPKKLKCSEHADLHKGMSNIVGKVLKSFENCPILLC